MAEKLNTSELLKSVPAALGFRAAARLATGISNGALSGETLPNRLKVFNWGANESTKGTFLCGEKSAEVLELNQRALGFERVAIDYNHCTVPGSPDYQKGTVPPVFGYGTVRLKSGDGIYLEDITWTPLGVQHAKNFEDLSPALHPETPGAEVDFLHSVALTTNGALKDVTFFSATDNPNPNSNHRDTTQFMDTNINKNILTLAIFASAMGLAANADEAAVTAELKAISDLKKALVGADGKVVVLDAIGGLDARLKMVEQATAAERGVHLVDLTAKITALETKLNESATRTAEQERSGLIARFSADGKVPLGEDGKALSAEALGKMDVSSLRLLHANTPVTVPLSARSARAQDGKTTDGLKGLEKTRAAFARQVAEELSRE